MRQVRKKDHLNQMNSFMNENRFSGGDKLYTKQADSKKYINAAHNNIPSILDKKLIIPLPFWFHTDVDVLCPYKIYYIMMLLFQLLRPIKELINYYDITHAKQSVTKFKKLFLSEV